MMRIWFLWGTQVVVRSPMMRSSLVSGDLWQPGRFCTLLVRVWHGIRGDYPTGATATQIRHSQRSTICSRRSLPLRTLPGTAQSLRWMSDSSINWATTHLRVSVTALQLFNPSNDSLNICSYNALWFKYPCNKTVLTDKLTTFCNQDLPWRSMVNLCKVRCETCRYWS